MCQLGHPLLKASGNGNIVYIFSVAGFLALPTASVYAASKGTWRYILKWENYVNGPMSFYLKN